MRAERRLAAYLSRAVVVLAIAGGVSPAVAHHPGGKAGPMVLIVGSQQGYRAVLQASPGDPTAGSPTAFSLWVTPEGMGYPYRGEARLWIRRDFPSPAPPTVIPMAQRGTAAGTYRSEYRFDRDGLYRVEVDLVRLQTRWAGSLRVDPAAPWILALENPLVFGGLMGAFMLFLWWQSRRSGGTP